MLMAKTRKAVQIVGLILGVTLPMAGLIAYFLVKRVGPVLRVHAAAQRLLRTKAPGSWDDRLQAEIARLGGPEAAVTRIDVYMRSSKPMEASAHEHELVAIEMLGLCGRAATPVLHRLANEGEPFLRVKVFDSLERIADPRSYDVLCGALNDKKQPIRLSAATTLGLIRDPRAVRPLLATFPAEKNVAVFMAVDEALARIGKPSVAPLTKLLETEKDPVIRGRIARIVKAINGRRSGSAGEKQSLGPGMTAPSPPTFPVKKLQQSTAAGKVAAIKRLRECLATGKGPVVHGFVEALVEGKRYGVKGASVQLVRVGEFKTSNVGGFVVPVDGASVYAMDTVEAGVFALRSDIPDGDYVLEASSPHDLNLTSGRKQLRVAGGKDVRVELTLRPGYLLRGRVFRPGTKTAVAGARITAHSLRKGVQWSRVVRTNKSGRYVLPLKSELPCKLIISGPEGGSLFIKRIEASEAGKAGVYAGVVTRDVALISGRKLTYTLIVGFRHERFSPAVSFSLRTMGKPARTVVKARSEARQPFQLKDLPAGDYEVVIVDKQWQLSPKETGRIEIDPDASAPVRHAVIKVEPTKD
jgi:HEAT repeats